MELVAGRRPAAQLLQILGIDKDVSGSDQEGNNWGMTNGNCNNYEKRRIVHGMTVVFPALKSLQGELIAWRARDRARLSAPSFAGHESNRGSDGDDVSMARFYACSFCSREFGSPQALGGHMNVHRHERAHLVAMAEATSSSSLSTISDATILLTPPSLHSVATHRGPSPSTSRFLSPAASLALFSKPSFFLTQPPISPSPPLDLELRLALQPT